MHSTLAMMASSSASTNSSAVASARALSQTVQNDGNSANDRRDAGVLASLIEYLSACFAGHTPDCCYRSNSIGFFATKDRRCSVPFQFAHCRSATSQGFPCEDLSRCETIVTVDTMDSLLREEDGDTEGLDYCYDDHAIFGSEYDPSSFLAMGWCHPAENSGISEYHSFGMSST